jgi:hypothetical protein
MAKKKQTEETVVENMTDEELIADLATLSDFSPNIIIGHSGQYSGSLGGAALNTNDLRVLQGLPPIEHLEPATVAVE